MYQDKKTISNQSHELNYWSEKFNCLPMAILVAKSVVGNKAVDVESYINEQRGNSITITSDKLWK